MKLFSENNNKFINKCLVIFISLLAVVALFPCNLFAQIDPIRFHHITTQDGLPQNVIYSIYQDKKGYMWFGMYNGLCRYDGYSFTNFQNNPEDTNSIPIGSVFAMCNDKNGDLWIGTSLGTVSFYHSRTEKFTSYTLNTNSESTVLPPISAIQEDKDGNIWIGMQTEGLAKLNRKSNKITYLQDWLISAEKKLMQVKSVTSIYRDKKNGLWIGLLNGGLAKYNESINKFEIIPLKTTSLKEKKINASVYCIWEDKKGLLWLGTHNGLIKYDPQTGISNNYLENKNLKFPEENTYIYTLCEDKDDFLWLGTYNKGLIKWNKRKGIVERYKYKEDNPFSIKTNKITSVYFDRSFNLWAGSEDGLHKADLKKPKFYLYMPSLYSFNNYSKKGIRDIYQDAKGNIWLGTEGNGLVMISEGEDPVVKRFLFDRYSESAYGYNYVNSLIEDKDNNIWVASIYGIAVLNKSLGSFLKRDNIIIKPLTDDSHNYSIIQDKYGTFWIGTRNRGLINYDPVSKSYHKYFYSKTDSNTISSNLTWTFFEDKDGELWIGTAQGTCRLIRNSHTGIHSFQRYKQGLGDDRLPGSNIWDINQDNNGNIWMASVDGGLKKLDKKTGRIEIFTTSHGLPSNVMCSILKDRKGFFWISTINGIFHFDPYKYKVIYKFNESHGLQDNRFNLRARYKNNKTGEMFFAGPNGFNRFHPDSILLNKFKPPLIISSFKVEYKESKNDLLDDSAITLSYKMNSISIEFAALDFTKPNENSFAYKLSGFDEKWTNSGKRHFVSYTNLKPGKYIFHLRGTNSDGLWSDEELKFTILIVPPFWSNWWFIALLGFLVLLIISVIFYMILANKEVKRKILQAELNSLRTQLNSHFVFNSLSSLQHFIMANEKTLALTYLSKFATLMRMILINSGKSLISLAEEKTFLELYLYMESVRFDNKFTFHFDLDPGLDIEKIKIPPLLLQPLVENALKHGLLHQQNKNGRILISCHRYNKDVKCFVEDNGIGRKMAETYRKNSSISGTSMGIKIVNDRIKMFNAGRLNKASVEVIDLYDSQNEPTGTRVEIIFPFLH